MNIEDLHIHTKIDWGSFETMREKYKLRRLRHLIYYGCFNLGNKS